MTGPVWDGQGADPWLPERLDHQGKVAGFEREVYHTFWARLSAWLVQVARAVLRHARPDAHAVHSTAPQWAQSMAEWIEDGPLLDVMGDAYQILFGGDYHFDDRPAVAAYLGGVFNRMVRTPDEVFDLVAREIAEGAGLGESIPELAHRVEEVLDATATERWPNRAVVVARTETLGALNAGREDAFAAISEEFEDDEFEHMWLATIDGRTRPTHLAADLQRQPLGTPFDVGGHKLDRPGDPNGPAHEIIQCLVDPDAPILTDRGWRPVASIRPGDLVVTHRGRLRPVLRLAPTRFHSGEVIRVETAAGMVRVTPNHPVLTSQGWVVAGELRPGMVVFRPTFVQRRDGLMGCHLLGVHRIVGRPSRSLGLGGKRQQDVRLLGLDHQERMDLPHNVHRLRAGQLPAEHHRPVRMLGRGVAVHNAPSGHLVQEADQALVAVGHHDLGEVVVRTDRAVDAAPFAGALADGDDTLAIDHGRNVGGSHRVHYRMLPQSVMTSSVEVVRDARLYNFAVAEDESYVAGGVAVHNCRCTTLLLRPGEDIDLSNRQYKG